MLMFARPVLPHLLAVPYCCKLYTYAQLTRVVYCSCCSTCARIRCTHQRSSFFLVFGSTYCNVVPPKPGCSSVERSPRPCPYILRRSIPAVTHCIHSSFNLARYRTRATFFCSIVPIAALVSKLLAGAYNTGTIYRGGTTVVQP